MLSSRRIAQTPAVQKAIGVLAAEYLRLVWWTNRLVLEPADFYERVAPELPVIVGFWHGQHFMTPFLRRGHKVKVLISRHRDGEINAAAARRLGVDPIRGSGDHGRRFDLKGGVGAFRTMLAALQDGWNVALTADVPKVSQVAGPGHRHARPALRAADLSGRDGHQPSHHAQELGPLRCPPAVRHDRHRRRRPGEGARPMPMKQSSKSAASRSSRASRRSPPAPMRSSTRAAMPARAERLPATLAAYRAVSGAATPLAPHLLDYRLRRGKEHAERMSERRGEPGATRPPGPLIWIHGASVGELIAVLPLIERMRARGFCVLATTGTVTSAALAEKRLPPGALHQFIPLDLPPYVARFLDHWRPDLALFVESDLWPNLIMSAADRQHPDDPGQRPNVGTLVRALAKIPAHDRSAARPLRPVPRAHTRRCRTVRRTGRAADRDHRQLEARRAAAPGRSRKARGAHERHAGSASSSPPPRPIRARRARSSKRIAASRRRSPRC